MYKNKLALIAVLALCTQQAVAATDLTAELSEPSSVIIIGTSPLASVGTPLNEVPANIQSGTGKEIRDQHALNLGEFMDTNLGSVNASNSVGNPYQMDISYRGFTASPILGTAIGMSVFVDGVRVNEPFGDIVNWDLIPTNAIAGINLIPGSNPLFGLNTLGGAIAINTKNGTSDPGLQVTISGGSWGRRALEAEYGSKDEDHDVDTFVATTLFHEDGYRAYSNSDVRQLFGKQRWHDSKSTLDLSMTLADNTMFGPSVLPLSMLGNPRNVYTAPDFVTNENGLLALTGSHYVQDDSLIETNLYSRWSNAVNGNSNASCDSSVMAIENCVANQSSGSLDASNVVASTHQLGAGATLQLSLSGNVLDHKNTFKAGTSVDASKVSYDSNTYGANLVGNYTSNIDPQGLDAINPANIYDQGGVRLTTRSNYYGVFATDNFAFSKQWNMTVSARYNYATVDLEGSSNNGTGTVGNLNGSHAYHRLNPAAGLNFRPGQDLTLYAGYNEGMRVPSPVELSCANPAIPCALPTGFTSDPNLDMIVSKTWEAGVRGKLSDHADWDFAAYQTRNQNDIQFIANGANNGATGFFQNVGSTERKGLELGVHARFDQFTLAANYGLVDATYQSAFSEAAPENSTANPVSGLITVNKGDRIPGIAGQTLKIRAGVDVSSAWNMGTSIIATSGQYAHGDENNQDINGELAGYATVNLDTHYNIGANWQLFAKVSNAGNKHYATFGILGQNMYTAQNELAVAPSTPRSIWIGLQYRFGGNKSSFGGED